MNESFLNRFQNKISTMTADGNLKRSDGIEVVRDGPRRRQTIMEDSKTTTSKTMYSSHDRVNQYRTSNQSYPMHPDSGNAHKDSTFSETLEKYTAIEPTEFSENLSKNINTNEYSFIESNNTRSPGNHEFNTMSSDYPPYQYEGYNQGDADEGYCTSYLSPHINSDSAEVGVYQCPESKFEGKAATSYSSIYKHSHNTHKKSKNENFKSRPQYQGETAMKPLDSSPSKINEEKAKELNDPLAFSKKGRKVKYNPCTLNEYKKEKQEKYIELGKLKPDLNTDELVAKRANVERIKAFSKNLRDINVSSGAKKKPEELKQKELSAREKALAFAKHVPKPKSLKNAVKTENEVDSYTFHDYDGSVGKLYNQAIKMEQGTFRLEELQQRHRASRVQVEAIRKGLSLP